MTSRKRPSRAFSTFGEVVPALENHASCGHDRIGTLPPGETRLLHDFVKRHLRGPPVDRKDRPFRQLVDGVVAPLTRSDLAAVDAQNLVKLGAVEGRRGRV